MQQQIDEIGETSSSISNNIIHRQELFDEVFCDAHFDKGKKKDVDIEKSYSRQEMLIGMHPDQATEKIIDMGLKYQKPFAVVPCCVFAYENPHRKLKQNPRYINIQSANRSR